MIGHLCCLQARCHKQQNDFARLRRCFARLIEWPECSGCMIASNVIVRRTPVNTVVQARKNVAAYLLQPSRQAGKHAL
jgi:hypothetical protein